MQPNYVVMSDELSLQAWPRVEWPSHPLSASPQRALSHSAQLSPYLSPGRASFVLMNLLNLTLDAHERARVESCELSVCQDGQSQKKKKNGKKARARIGSNFSGCRPKTTRVSRKT